MGIFGIHDSIDKYKMLIKQYGRYENDKTSLNKASAFFDTAWHLIDWVYDDFKETLNEPNLGEFRRNLYERFPHFKILHDIANTSKHKILSRPKSAILDTRKQNGAFTSTFTSQFQSTFLVLEMEDGTIYQIETMISEVLSFWIYFFKHDLQMPDDQLAIRLDDYTDI